MDGTGSLTTLSIVRLLETDGNLVTPDLQNPDHFSSAP